MVTIPSHLQECVVFQKWEPEDASQPEGRGYLTALVHCVCGGEAFEFLFPGQTHIYEGEEIPVTANIDGLFFFIIKAKCSACEKEYLIFDADFHGWDGFVCHDLAKASLPRPKLVIWNCRACNGFIHTATIGFASEGKDDFVEATDGTIDENKWMNGFGWIDISLTCCECGKYINQWVSYETM